MTISTNEPAARAKAGKYLTFTLSGERYGISIALVQEVVGMLAIAPVPNTPRFVLGVINLRGRIVPLIDLRRKLKMPASETRSDACILILKVPIKDGVFSMGMTVDAVHEIRQVEQQDISLPPNFGVKLSTDYLDGVVKVGDEQAILLLNAIRALTASDLSDVQNAAEAGETDDDDNATESDNGDG